MYNFLIQFFKLFPELQGNDFYNGGVSYGDIYRQEHAPAIAHYIHKKNSQNPVELKINLKGLFLETPFSDPIRQVEYGEYLYHAGLIDDLAREHFRAETEIIRDLISQGKYLEAQELKLKLLWGSEYGTYFSNVTGFSATDNILKDTADISQTNFAALVEKEYFRNALHVGNLSMTLVSPLVQTLFRPNVLKSVKPLIEDLLNLDYNILIYSGNLDIITSHIRINTMVKSFNWTGTEEYLKTPSKIWRVNETIARYARNVWKFTYVVMRNAGHGASGDQQVWAFDLLNRVNQRIAF